MADRRSSALAKRFAQAYLGAALAPPTYRVASLRAPLQSGWGPGAYQWFEGMSRQPEPVALERTLASSCDAVFDFILVRAVGSVWGSCPWL